MAQAGYFPPRYSIPRQKGRQYQIYDIRLCRPETAGSRHEGNLILVAEQEQITWFDWRQESLQMASDLRHRSADHILWSRRSSRGGDQNCVGFRANQMLKRAPNRRFFLDRIHLECGRGPKAFQPLAHDIVKKL